MMNNSVIRHSGQVWKLVLAALLMIAGSVLPLFEQLGISWTVGTIIAAAGYVLALAGLVCPSCKARWMWMATLDATLYGPLFKESSCPKCERNFADVS
ncbi:MAG: hypothetical protein AB8G17_06455 [Gammaproteobacteria bacterium]